MAADHAMGKLHKTVKARCERLREETGVFPSVITIDWDGREVKAISVSTSSQTKYDKKEDDDG